jgi:hypothetical protein
MSTTPASTPTSTPASGPPHTPAVHAMPAPQRMAQPPQFAGSVSASMHAPPQSVVPVGHEATHVPAEQIGVVPEHAVPRAPQLAGSVRTSTHLPAHSREVASQVHALAAQI